MRSQYAIRSSCFASSLKEALFFAGTVFPVAVVIAKLSSLKIRGQVEREYPLDLTFID